MEREFGIVLAKLESIEHRLTDADNARKGMYERIETTNRKVDHLAWQIEALEKNLSSISPTVAEFLTYKEQVRGAGRLGKFLWFVGGLVLSAAASVSGWLHFTK